MDAPFIKSNFAPTLREQVETAKLPCEALIVGLRLNAVNKIEIADRHDILLVEGGSACQWRVPSLRDLFRGDRIPPVFGSRPSQEYDGCFFVIEWHMTMICDAEGNRTDQEFAELYTAMRKRPDGKSLGKTHDFLWQASALLLGMRPTSAQEFEAIMGRLALSAKHFSTGLVSRNYIENIRPCFPKN